MQYPDTPQGEFEATLKNQASKLLENLEGGQISEAVRLLCELNQVRDRGLYHEVGKLTRELHSAIVNFQIDIHGHHAEEISQITDATQRLNYVVQMTENAANRTMDLVEESAPLVGHLMQEANTLSDEWARFMRRELSAEEFRGLAHRVEGFLGKVGRDSGVLSCHLNDILLAQDFQDLTGQVIKRVTALVTDVEQNLVKLVLMASNVERYAGIQHDPSPVDDSKSSTHAEGPQINAANRVDVVAGQDDVDDLLSSLGF